MLFFLLTEYVILDLKAHSIGLYYDSKYSGMVLEGEIVPIIMVLPSTRQMQMKNNHIACHIVIGTECHQGKGHRYGYGFSFMPVCPEADHVEVSFGDEELKTPRNKPVWISEVFLMRENRKCKVPFTV